MDFNKCPIVNPAVKDCVKCQSQQVLVPCDVSLYKKVQSYYERIIN